MWIGCADGNPQLLASLIVFHMQCTTVCEEVHFQMSGFCT